MLVWVVYDISSNKTRNKAVKFCKNKGLYRIQKSVFLGVLNQHEKTELRAMMEDLISDSNDSVYIFPSQKCFLEDTDLIGKGFDKELIKGDIITRFI